VKQWFRDHYPADDAWLYYEIDDERFVRRHIAMEGPEPEVYVACSIDEVEDAIRAETVAQYCETYGELHEWSFTRIDRENPEPITQVEFESIWKHARQVCESRHRSA